MSTTKFYHLVNIPDYRHEKEKSDIDYARLSDDCDNKTISILEAITVLSDSICSLTENNKMDKDKLRTLSGVIYDLAELAIATNKISQSASYSSGYIDGENKNVA